jgi:hypothetical protein
VTHGEGVSLLALSRTTGKRPSAEEQLLPLITELVKREGHPGIDGSVMPEHLSI